MLTCGPRVRPGHYCDLLLLKKNGKLLCSQVDSHHGMVRISDLIFEQATSGRSLKDFEMEVNSP